MNPESAFSFGNTILQAILLYAPRAILGLVTLFVGWKAINWMCLLFDRQMTKREMDPSLRPFLVSMAKNLIRIALLISIASMLGIATTSFVAIFAALGLAIGFALQGSLGNFAGGVLILVFRPFKVGDMINVMGESGVVKRIEMFCTILTTADNRTVILPNGPLSNGVMVNFSTEDNRRVDMSFGIGHSDDFKRAKALIQDILITDNRILKDPPPFVAIGELTPSSVKFTVQAWVKNKDYSAVYFDTHEKVKMTFADKGVSIPFPPQQDIDAHQIQQ